MKAHHVIVLVILLLVAYFVGIKYPGIGNSILSKF